MFFEAASSTALSWQSCHSFMPSIISSWIRILAHPSMLIFLVFLSFLFLPPELAVDLAHFKVHWLQDCLSLHSHHHLLLQCDDLVTSLQCLLKLCLVLGAYAWLNIKQFGVTLCKGGVIVEVKSGGNVAPNWVGDSNTRNEVEVVTDDASLWCQVCTVSLLLLLLALVFVVLPDLKVPGVSVFVHCDKRLSWCPHPWGLPRWVQEGLLLMFWDWLPSPVWLQHQNYSGLKCFCNVWGFWTDFNAALDSRKISLSSCEVK